MGGSACRASPRNGRRTSILVKGKFSKKKHQAGSATFEEGVPYAETEHLFWLTMLRGLPNIDGTGRLNIGEGETKLTLIHAAVAFRLSYLISHLIMSLQQAINIRASYLRMSSSSKEL